MIPVTPSGDLNRNSLNIRPSRPHLSPLDECLNLCHSDLNHMLSSSKLELVLNN